MRLWERVQLPHELGWGEEECGGAELSSWIEKREDEKFPIRLVNNGTCLYGAQYLTNICQILPHRSSFGFGNAFNKQI